MTPTQTLQTDAQTIIKILSEHGPKLALKKYMDICKDRRLRYYQKVQLAEAVQNLLPEKPDDDARDTAIHDLIPDPQKALGLTDKGFRIGPVE